MLSEDERQAVEAVLENFPRRSAGCLEALRIIQDCRGWVSDEAIRDIAAAVGLSPDELDGVATFYNLIFRKPVGRHVILICDSISCWILGYEKILDRLRSRLGIGVGETTPDARFTLLPVCCLGACDRAPTLMVDSDLHGDVTPDKLESILEKYK
jgi:NADH-quinone oxidoreductase subunit E